jgi:predicted porin
MKKTAIAAVLAVMTSAAAAQNVEVYGKMRQYVETDRVGTAQSLTKVSDDTSRLGFRGKEDLGGGLSAFFTVETAVASDAPNSGTTSIGDRTSVFGLETKHWSLGLGRDNHRVTRTILGWDPMKNEFGTMATAIHNTHGARLSNAVFLTVKPATGFAAHYIHSSSEVADVPDAKSYGVDATLGPVEATVAAVDNGAEGDARRFSANAGARMALGQATTLFAVYSEDEVGSVKTEGKQLGLHYKLTPATTLMGAVGAKQGMDAYAVGLMYNFSKRTILHAKYLEVAADDAAQDRRRIGVGLEHNF